MAATEMQVSVIKYSVSHSTSDDFLLNSRFYKNELRGKKVQTQGLRPVVFKTDLAN